MSSKHIAGPVLILAAFLAPGRPQAALAAESKTDDADPATKVQKMNRYAMQLFDDLNYALAEKTLLEALAIVEKSNLGAGPAGLATNGNLAVLYSVGLRNPDKAVFHFKKALTIKPDLKMSKQRATPETEANLARAKAEMGGAKIGQPATEGAAEPGLKCPTSGEVQAGDDITLKCLTSAELPAAALLLHYKPSGGDRFEVVQMTKSGTSAGTTTWVGKIPGPQIKSKSVFVYFEARDAGGSILANSGNEDSPSVITVQGGEDSAAAHDPTVDTGQGQGADGEEEEDEEGEEIDDNNPLARLENERYREHQGSKGTWWGSLGVGSGFGYASGHGTEAYGKRYGVTFNAGLAPALLGQAVPEVGLFISRNTAVAIAGRLQWIKPSGPDGTATGAITGLLRLLFFTEDEGKMRWYFATTVGAGEGFRFQVNAAVGDSSGTPTGKSVKDTVRGGPYVAGIGGGMLYKLNRHWRWTVDTQVLVGFGNVSGVLDLSTGARYQF